MTASTPNPLKRKAWRYQKAAMPTWRDALRPGQSRKRFFKAWFFNPLSYLSDLFGHFALKLLPVDVCSALGGQLGKLVMRYKYPSAQENMRSNLRQMLPTFTTEEIERLVVRNSENLGRFMAEFSVIHRICASRKRLQISGLDDLLSAVRQGPVILVTLHLGNWEVLPVISKRTGVSFHTFFLPLGNPVEAWIAYRTRRKLGAQLLPLAMDGVRPALKILKQGGVVALFCDEGFAGQIRGPLLGRPPHLRGNLGLAVRLARHSNARLCIVASKRLHGAHFECRFGPILSLPPQPVVDNTSLLQDVQRLNTLVESEIITHCDQWYFLHDRLS